MNFSLSQKKAQIILISDHDVRFYLWQKKTLTELVHYEELIAQQYDDHPVIVIVNILEENFRFDTMIPVTGRDRKALLERKLDFAFRGSEYRAGRVLQQSRDGRRDYTILLTAITKPAIIQPWIDPLYDKKRFIQSITSTGYLCEKFIQQASLNKEEYCLVLSIERHSELRQNFFHNGILSFSRKIPLTATDGFALSEEIFTETLQLRSYLERSKMLPYQGLLSVHIFAVILAESMDLEARTTPFLQFRIHDLSTMLDELPAKLKVNNKDVNLVYLASLLPSTKIPNRYASLAKRKYYLLRNSMTAAAYAAAALVVVAIGLSGPRALQAYVRAVEIEQLVARTQPVLREYEELSKSFPLTPASPQDMELVVSTAETIAAQSHSPVATMLHISESLSDSPNLQITRIEWEIVASASETPSQNEDYYVEPEPPRYQTNSRDDNESLKIATLNGNTQLRVSIEGLVYSPANNYRLAQNEVLSLSNNLDSLPEIEIIGRTMPTNIRTDVTVVATVDGNELRAPFDLQLLVENP